MDAPTDREKRLANEARIELDCPGLLAELRKVDHVHGRAWWPDLDEQLANLVWPRYRSPAPSTAQRAAGVYFDAKAVTRFLRFCALLRHIKGKRWANEPFIPDVWQIVHALGPVLGWKRPDGLRLYNELFLEVPRKNGKSTLVAAIGLFLLVADDEPGAEVYCLEPSTRVLCSDLVWRPVGDLGLGDELVAFDEEPLEPRKFRKLRTAAVTDLDRIRQPCYRVTFEDGRTVVASALHRWLGKRYVAGQAKGWVATEDLIPGSRIRDIGTPWEADDSWGAGYLAGVWDGEGSFHRLKDPGGRDGFRMAFAQRPGEVMDLTRSLLKERDFDVSAIRQHANGVDSFELRGLRDCFRFLGQVRPRRLLAQAPAWWEGRAPSRTGYATVTDVEELGEREVVAIGTTTKTLIAEGLLSHNSVAKDRDQARAVWAVGALMARAAPALRRRLRIPPNPAERGDTISYRATNSVWTVLGKDRKGDKHHGLNIHGALIDELHTINDPELIGTIETGTGSREQPLRVVITTAGIESDSPVWASKRDYAVKVAERVLDAPTFWGAIFCADPKVQTSDAWLNPDVWRGSNPGWGRSIRPEYLEQMATTAKANPVDRNRFLRLHLGIPTESSVGYIELPVWDRSAGLVIERELYGEAAYGGLDLSDSRDLCAFVLVVPDASGALDVVARVWTPEATLHSRAMRDRADYVRWAADGWLTLCPGETIDYDQVEAELGALKALFDIRGVNYDRWGSKQLRDHLETARLPIWDMGQGFASMSSPMKDTARIVTERRLRHGGNPVLRYACSGMRALEDPAGNVKPDRKRSTSRIDPMAALIMAIDAFIRQPGGRSVYEDRGVEAVG